MSSYESDKKWIMEKLDPEILYKMFGIDIEAMGMGNAEELAEEILRKEPDVVQNLKNMLNQREHMDENITPAQEFIAEAMDEIDNDLIKHAHDDNLVDPSNLVEDQEYLAILYDGIKIRCKFVGMGDFNGITEYIFQNVFGGEILADASGGVHGKNTFPVPEQLISTIKFYEIKD